MLGQAPAVRRPRLHADFTRLKQPVDAVDNQLSFDEAGADHLRLKAGQCSEAHQSARLPGKTFRPFSPDRSFVRRWHTDLMMACPQQCLTRERPDHHL